MRGKMQLGKRVRSHLAQAILAQVPRTGSPCHFLSYILPCGDGGCWLLGGSDANGANGRVGEACCGGCAHGGHTPWTEPIPLTQVMSLLV